MGRSCPKLRKNKSCNSYSRTHVPLNNRRAFGTPPLAKYENVLQGAFSGFTPRNWSPFVPFCDPSILPATAVLAICFGVKEILMTTVRIGMNDSIPRGTLRRQTQEWQQRRRKPNVYRKRCLQSLTHTRSAVNQRRVAKNPCMAGSIYGGIQTVKTNNNFSG